MSTIRKTAAVILSVLVLAFTTVSILAIWDFIQIEDVMRRSVTTLFILFIAAAVLLFLFSVVFKGADDKGGSARPPKQPPMG